MNVLSRSLNVRDIGLVSQSLVTPTLVPADTSTLAAASILTSHCCRSASTACAHASAWCHSDGVDSGADAAQRPASPGSQRTPPPSPTPVPADIDPAFRGGHVNSFCDSNNIGVSFIGSGWWIHCLSIMFVYNVQELARRWDSECELLRRHRTYKGQRLRPLSRLPNFYYT